MTGQASGTSIGAGQQVPFDGNSDFTALIFVINQLIAGIDSLKICQVVAVHPGQGSPPAIGTVDVQLLTNLLDGAGNATQQGIVYGLTYFRFQAGPWAIIAEPQVGDFGFAVCADRDISSLKNAYAAGQTPSNSNPSSCRKYNISDGVYFGGCLNKVPTATMWLKSDGSLLITDKLGNVIQSNSNGLTITPPSGGGLTVNGYIRASGEITRGFGGGDSVTLGSHTHDQGVDSHGDTEQPTSAPNAGT